MRSLVSTPNGPSAAEIQEVPEPVSGPGEVLIEVKAASLNRGELNLLPNRPGWRPGQDVAGVVVAAAVGADGPPVGTRVVAAVDQGGWAERVPASIDRLAVLPDGVSFEAGATLPVAGLTALRALRAAGVRLAIVSSGLSALAERVATDLDIELRRANELHVDGGRFTGEATLHVPVGDKGPAFRETVTSLDVPFETVVAVGDGTGDADMFRLAGLGVAFCPLSFEVADAADAVIDVPDMRHLLPLVLG